MYQVSRIHYSPAFKKNHSIKYEERGLFMKKHIAFILLSITLIFMAPFLVTANGTSEKIPLDPHVRTGTLENGLSYYVQKNSMPEERAYLRLVVNAGSTQEDEDQLGMAHLLEHMAFNGTRNYQKNDLVKYLQGIGMQFGPDINAHTSFDETVYKLMIPLDKPENLTTGMEILEEWAFHMNLTDEDIEDERGIILEERRTGLGASRRMMDAAYPDIMYNSLYAERLPIGTEESIKNSTPEAIRRFYRDWYRPDLMAIVAVGDFDPDSVVQMIKTQFSPYKNPAVPRERKEAEVPYHSETIYSIQQDPESTWTAAIIFNKFPRETVRTVEDYRKEIIREIYIRIFNNRLTELLDQPEPPYTYAYVDFTSLTRSTDFHTMTVLSADDNLYEAYETVLTEEKKLKDHGITQSELDRAVKELTSEFKTVFDNRNNIDSAEIVSWYVNRFLNRDPAPGIAYQWDIFNRYVPEITTDQIMEEASQWLTGENRVVYTMAPERRGLDPIDPIELSRINVLVSHKETAPPQDLQISENLLDQMPAPGEILEKDHFEGPDVYEWTLANGARVVLKQTDFKENEILFSALAPGGLSLVDDEDYISADFADDAVVQGGAGNHSKRDLEKILAGANISLEPDINDLTSGFNGSSTREDLEKMLQLTYLYFMEPRIDETLWLSYKTRVQNNLANRDSNPMNRYSDLITSVLYQDDFRHQPLTAETLDKVDLNEAFTFYRQVFNNASGYTFFFTGSISPEELEPYIEAYIASLPGGGTERSWIDRGARHPQGVIKESLKAGKEPLSYVTLIYTGLWEWSDRETEVFQALSDSLDIILNEKLREQAAGTYSPGVGAYPSKIPFEDYAFLISFSCDPERVDELVSLVRDILNDLKKNPPEKRITEDVAKSRWVYLEEQMQKNSFWLSRLKRNYLLEMPRESITPRDYLSGYYTPEIFQDRIIKYLKSENSMEILLFPEE